MKTTLRILSVILAAMTLCLCVASCSGGGASSKLAFKSPNGTTVTIGADADPIIDALGSYVTSNNSPSCGGFQGNDYVYTYNGFRVSTTPAKNGQIVCKVELTDDSVKTPEGLYIGMSRADVEKAMKAFTAESVGDNLVYTDGGVKLQVILRSGSVSGIVYVAK